MKRTYARFSASAVLILLATTTMYAQVPLNDDALMAAYQDRLRTVSQTVLPVVVEVDTVQRVSRQGRSIPSPLEYFFGRPNQDNDRSSSREREFEQRGMGSGILVRRDGDTVYVLTNNHVAGSADQINVTLYDERAFTAELVGTDPNRDLALLSFETDQEIPIAELGNSDRVQVGDLVLAVGNPLGFASTVTSGIVSAVERQGPRRTGMAMLTDYIQTDAAINRGNSGGALVNLQGQVIGINTWIASQSGGSIGLGFAIPANNAKRAIDQFIANGRVEYGWLGVNMADPPNSPSDSLGESSGGAFVYNVYENSPADQSGILPGDIVLGVGGSDISDSEDLLRAVTALEPGTRTRFRILRAGERRTVQVRTGVRPVGDDSVPLSDLWPGISVAEATAQVRENLGMGRNDGDLIVGQVADGSPAHTAGLRSGDIVSQINGRSVETLSDFYGALNDRRSEEIVFRIRRNDTNLIIGLIRP